MQSIIKQLFNQFFIESLIFGNIGKDEAISMILMVEEFLKPKILIKSRLIKIEMCYYLNEKIRLSSGI